MNSITSWHYGAYLNVLLLVWKLHDKRALGIVHGLISWTPGYRFYLITYATRTVTHL